MMSQAQKEYAAAKAAFEAARTERNRRMEPHHPLLDTDLEQYVDLEIAVENELHYDDLRTALMAAENAMIEWAHETIKALPQYRNHVADMQIVFERGVKHFKIRQQIIDTCYALDTSL